MLGPVLAQMWERRAQSRRRCGRREEPVFVGRESSQLLESDAEGEGMGWIDVGVDADVHMPHREAQVVNDDTAELLPPRLLHSPVPCAHGSNTVPARSRSRPTASILEPRDTQPTLAQ